MEVAVDREGEGIIRMSLLDEWKEASNIEDKGKAVKAIRSLRRKRCPFLDEKWICKVSRDFVEKGARDTLFRCTCSLFYVNCDIYKKYWHEGGEIVE